jgi:hypothetical protein
LPLYILQTPGNERRRALSSVDESNKLELLAGIDITPKRTPDEKWEEIYTKRTKAITQKCPNGKLVGLKGLEREMDMSIVG